MTTLESVIGPDDRRRVPDPRRVPWRRICRLTITGGNGAVARGTACFIGPRTLLTAGHCVFSTVLFDGWASEITVEPARNGEELPFHSARSTWFSTLQRWTDTQEPDSDVGCIQLDEALGDAVGWFRLDNSLAETPDPVRLVIAGYPVDLDNGSALYTSESQLLRMSDAQLFYDVDTVGGQSGAPIWVWDPAGEPRVVGVHGYGSSGTLDPVLGVEVNAGRRITSDLLVTTAGWLHDNR